MIEFARSLPARLGAAGAVRVAIVAFTVIGCVLVPHPRPAVILAAVFGGLLATSVFAFAGALLALLALVVGWVAAYGGHDPAPERTVAFAIVLYLLYSATSLVASLPLGTRLDGAVVRNWARNCLPALGCAVVGGAVVALIGRPSGSLVLDVVGVAGAAGAAGAVFWLARGRQR